MSTHEGGDSPKKKREPFATNESLFEAINQFRKQLSLQPLIWDDSLIGYSDAIQQNKRPDYNVGRKDEIVMTCNTFCEQWKLKSSRYLIEKWMYIPERRQVLLAPGTHGAASIFSSPTDKKNYVAVFIASIYKPE